MESNQRPSDLWHSTLTTELPRSPYSIATTCIFDTFMAMLLTVPSFWDVTTCHWVIQKSRGLEFLNLWILEVQSIMFFLPETSVAYYRVTRRHIP